jgi:hypothetical protein
VHPENYGHWRLYPFLLESRIVEVFKGGTAAMVRLRDGHTTSTAAATTTEESPLLPNPFDSTALEVLRTAVANTRATKEALSRE